MRTFKFLLTAFWIALFPVGFLSCEPSVPENPENTEKPDTPNNPNNPNNPDTPEDSDATIVGSWKITKAIRQNSEGASQDLTSLEGQLWTFGQSNVLTVDNQEFDYSISETRLNTSYAEIYATTFFTIQELSKESLTLYSSYEERDKVGKRLIFYTFVFERVN